MRKSRVHFDVKRHKQMARIEVIRQNLNVTDKFRGSSRDQVQYIRAPFESKVWASDEIGDIECQSMHGKLKSPTK